MTPALVVGGLVAAMVLLALPRRVLPVLAVASFVLVPVGYMDITRVIGRYYTPAVIIVLVWVLRLIFGRDGRTVPAHRSPASLLWIPVLALVAISTFQSTSVTTSLSWMVVVIITVLLPYYLGRRHVEDIWPRTQSALIAVALFLGVLATADYLFDINPWTSLFSYDVNERVWSIFRTRTSLGHPLVTATVASVCVMVALFGTRSRRFFRVLGLAGGGVALVLAVSRTSVLAVALGVAVGCLILMFGPKAEGRSKRAPAVLLLLAGVAFTLAVFNSPLLTERNESTGGAASALYREQSTDVALSMIAENWFSGTGPGTAPTRFAEIYDGPLENSAFQLLLSLGVPLATVCMGAAASVIARLALRGEATLAAALLAFAVSVVGFSAIDVNPALLVILSPLLYRAGQVLGQPDEGSDTAGAFAGESAPFVKT